MAFLTRGQQKLLLISLVAGIIALLLGNLILFQIKKRTEGIVD